MSRINETMPFEKYPLMHHFPLPIFPLIILQEVDSTNNYAMARINEGGADNGTVWLALHQTTGKGQRGKRWQSEPGQNIMMSVVLRPYRLSIFDQFMLSSAVALGSYDFVKNYAGDSTSIKWSNDIYVGDKKAGGILIENVIRGNKWEYAVAGIGINLNQESFSPDLPNPVSLYQITGKKYELVQMAEELYRSVMDRFEHLHPEHYDQLAGEYCSRLYHFGKKQLFSSKDEKFEAVIKGVEKDGRLVVERGGKLVSIHFGQVSFVI